MKQQHNRQKKKHKIVYIQIKCNPTNNNKSVLLNCAAHKRQNTEHCNKNCCATADLYGGEFVFVFGSIRNINPKNRSKAKDKN